MKECPKCSSDETVKSGKIRGKQRYKCKACNYHYTVIQKSDTSTASDRKLALTLYLEGLGFRSIGRVMGYSHVAVYNWIKAFGGKIEALVSEPAAIVEMDEMHTYIGDKKTIAGSGLLLIDLNTGLSMLSQVPEELLQDKHFGMKLIALQRFV